MSIVGIFVLRADARYLFDGLTSRGRPFVAVAGAGSLWALLRASPTVRASSDGGGRFRPLGLGGGQWDYMLLESLTISEAAAPKGTIVSVLVAVGLAVLLVVRGSCCCTSWINGAPSLKRVW